MKPVFARTRHVYGSYSDFWRLVELSGFETCFIDQIRLDTEETYIVTPINGEFRPHIENERLRLSLRHEPVRANVIWWALERPDHPGSVPWPDTVTDLLQYVDEVWASSRFLLDGQRVQWVPMGSHLALSSGPRNVTFDYDVAMMAYMTPRRQTIADELVKRGFRLAPNAWGEERDRILRSTRCMLSVHQNDKPAPMEEPLRIALAAAYELPLVSEHVRYPLPLIAGVHYADAKYGQLVATVDALLRMPALASDLGNNLRQLLCVERTFRACVEEALR